MGQIALIAGEELYYGAALAGVKRSFLVRFVYEMKKTLNQIKEDKSLALVIIEKELESLLDQEDSEFVHSSQSPLFFFISREGKAGYGKELASLIAKLGVKSDES